jgi:hypothetical protein
LRLDQNSQTLAYISGVIREQTTPASQDFSSRDQLIRIRVAHSIEGSLLRCSPDPADRLPDAVDHLDRGLFGKVVVEIN